MINPFRRKANPNTLKMGTQVYELKPGSHYLIEVDMYKTNQEALHNAAQMLWQQGQIAVTFLMTKGGDALHAVPAVPAPPAAEEQPVGE